MKAEITLRLKRMYAPVHCRHRTLPTPAPWSDCDDDGVVDAGMFPALCNFGMTAVENLTPSPCRRLLGL